MGANIREAIERVDALEHPWAVSRSSARMLHGEPCDAS
jgi:hypothetical protein